MIVRLLATLIALGLFVGSVEARELPGPSPATAMLVEPGPSDSADDLPAMALLMLPPVPMPYPGVVQAWSPSSPPPGHHHCMKVFRPPRAYAFN